MLQQLYNFYPLKSGFFEPDMHLGVKLCKTRLHNGIWAKAMIPVKYIQEAVSCTVNLVANDSGKFRLPKKAENPFKMGYDSKLDNSPKLDLP